ncbi:hypothetical protein MTR67_030981 [Solanum verrucosum]|uniref:Uncharacterized protein n=1 Tax=Solanum verrucosum TaxID=315347 RepID=A0AAF0U1M2_SOLVR|nr:hypothetical protein MTR67_030981 [Solanum verrucosum]
MGSVEPMEEEIKELAKDVYRLARLEVNEKQGSDPILLQLKGVVHQQRVDVLSRGEDGVLHYQGRLCVSKVGE